MASKKKVTFGINSIYYFNDECVNDSNNYRCISIITHKICFKNRILKFRKIIKHMLNRK